MKTVTLNTGAAIPVLGYGSGTAWGSHRGAPLDRGLVEVTKTALALGYRHLDCAESYHNEREIGIAIKESGMAREDIFLATKLWPSVHDPARTFASSLQKLQTEYVDLYLLHCPFFSPSTHGTNVRTVWTEFEKIAASGKARAIGVSNFQAAQLRELLSTAKVKPAVNQIELHPYCIDHELIALCEAEGIVLQAYSPLSPISRFSGGPLDPVLARLVEKHGKNQGQVLLRWGLQKGFVVISTSSKESRLREYLDAADDSWELSLEEVDEIERVGKDHHRRQFWKQGYGEK